MLASPLKAGRAERLVVPVVVLAVVALYAWASFYRLDWLDEGYFIYTSSRVFAGEVPYRDFSTPYTPAFFYLNAVLFRLFGLDILTLRFSLIVPRVGTLLLTYLLGRRLMPPAFALIGPAILFVEDPQPGAWESHPAWWSTFFALLAVWCVARYRERRSLRWWLGGAAACALAFAFKQNFGLFALGAMAAVACAEWAALPTLRLPAFATDALERLPRRARAWSLGLAGSIAVFGLFLVVTFMTRQHQEPRLFMMLSAPFAGLGLVYLRDLLVRLDRGEEPADAHCLGSLLGRLLLLGSVFTLLTLPWMIGLALALGPDNLPVTQFLGGIDTAGYFLALDPTTPSFLSALGLALLAPATVWCLSRPWRPMVKVALVAGVVCLGAAFAWDILRRADEVEPRLVRAVLYLTIEAGYAAILYAPTAAFWAGFGMLWRSRRSWLPLFDLRWLLLAGNLMLLNQYPRLDEIHLLFSAPLLWAIGGYVLYRVHGRFSRSLRATARLALWRPAMFAALLCFPLLIVWPALEPRREDLFVRRTGSPLDITTPRYEPLGLSGASVLEQERFAWRYRVLAGYVDRHVPANERIFVFPAAPLLYYLFDRPNATRFNHIFPGLLSSADERETLERLASPSVNWIAWDTFGAEYWNKDKAYPALTSYIWDNFEPVASAGDIELMRRR